MSATILHLSDLHFGDPKAILKRVEMDRVLQALLNRAGPDVTLVLSGDITFKGQQKGYAEAQAAIQDTLIKFGLPPHRVIACPGNHDIVKADGGWPGFDAFDAWSASMRSDKRCTFAGVSCRHVICDAMDFLVLNTAHHGAIEYGLVDFDQMDVVLGEMGPEPTKGRFRVAVMHHHLVPVSADENSATRNAYGVLSRLAKHGFSLVLHGHQHALLNLNVGEKPMRISGVGSFRYSTPGFVNSATIHRMHATESLPTDFYAVSKDASDYLMAVTPDF